MEEEASSSRIRYHTGRHYVRLCLAIKKERERWERWKLPKRKKGSEGVLLPKEGLKSLRCLGRSLTCAVRFPLHTQTGTAMYQVSLVYGLMVAQ